MQVEAHLHCRQESDEYVCLACKKRWDIHEDAPTCMPPQPRIVGMSPELGMPYGSEGYDEAKVAERDQYEQAARVALPPPKAVRKAGLQPEKVLLFRMLMSIEQRYPAMADNNLRPKVLRQYRQWLQEQRVGQAHW